MIELPKKTTLVKPHKGEINNRHKSARIPLPKTNMGRGKTKTKERIGANKTLNYGSGARLKSGAFEWIAAGTLYLKEAVRKPVGGIPTRPRYAASRKRVMPA